MLTENPISATGSLDYIIYVILYMVFFNISFCTVGIRTHAHSILEKDFSINKLGGFKSFFDTEM